MYDLHRYDWLKEAVPGIGFRRKAAIILNNREYAVVCELFLHNTSRADVAESLQVTRERVRQILSLAEFKLRRMRDAKGGTHGRNHK